MSIDLDERTVNALRSIRNWAQDLVRTDSSLDQRTRYVLNKLVDSATEIILLGEHKVKHIFS